MTDFIVPIIMIAVYAWVCWHDRPKPESVVVADLDPSTERATEREYELTLIHPDGEFCGILVAQGLPRHVHIAPGGGGYLSDDPTPSIEGAISFDRIGSSVHVDDERDALFVRRTS